MTELEFAISKNVDLKIKVLDNKEVLVRWNNGMNVEVISYEEAVKLNILSEEIKEDFDGIQLTDKEKSVLLAIVDNGIEYGVPVYIDDFHREIKMTKKSIVGVISSLYKKGFLEAYEVDNVAEEFHLTEYWFEKLA